MALLEWRGVASVLMMLMNGSEFATAVLIIWALLAVVSSAINVYQEFNEVVLWPGIQFLSVAERSVARTGVRKRKSRQAQRLSIHSPTR